MIHQKPAPPGRRRSAKNSHDIDTSNESGEVGPPSITPSEHLRHLMLERENSEKTNRETYVTEDGNKDLSIANSQQQSDSKVESLPSNETLKVETTALVGASTVLASSVKPVLSAAEEKRRRREMFLNDLDNFSTNFAVVSAAPQSISEVNTEKELLTAMQQTSQNFVVHASLNKLENPNDGNITVNPLPYPAKTNQYQVGSILTESKNTNSENNIDLKTGDVHSLFIQAPIIVNTPSHIEEPPTICADTNYISQPTSTTSNDSSVTHPPPHLSTESIQLESSSSVTSHLEPSSSASSKIQPTSSFSSPSSSSLPSKPSKPSLFGDQVHSVSLLEAFKSVADSQMPVSMGRSSPQSSASPHLPNRSTNLSSSNYTTLVPETGSSTAGESATEVLRMPTRIGNPNKNKSPSATISPSSVAVNSQRPVSQVLSKGNPTTYTIVDPREVVSVRPAGHRSSSTSASAAAAAALPFNSPALMFDNPMAQRSEAPDSKAPAQWMPPQEQQQQQQQQQQEPYGYRNAYDNGDDDEEEGHDYLNEEAHLAQFLTREERRAMSPSQKADWKVKQADMKIRRKDFHGAVTYIFDGIFSWQMYGSADAVDESGAPYTEYLMRCQWGSTFENMHPWIVAHRFKEFDFLDHQIRKQFAYLARNLVALPKKEIFRNLDPEVIAKRRHVLEDYMSRIVLSLPSIVRSELFNNFLSISERIAAIRVKLNLTMPLTSASNPSALRTAGGEWSDMQPMATPPHRPIQRLEAGGLAGKSFVNTVNPMLAGGGHRRVDSTSESKAGLEDSFEYGDSENETLYLTVEAADLAKEQQQSRSLDEDQLGDLEEQLRKMNYLLKAAQTHVLLAMDSEFRRLLKSVTHRWPNLRATAVVGMNVDFTLIPRAMQAEEDLTHYINEFRSLEFASGCT